MAMKRSREKCDEFDDLSAVSHPSPNAKIQGIITELSPIKKGKTTAYFDGEIADDQSRKRLFGFDKEVRRRLLEHHEKNEPVVLSHCEVKQSKFADKLEVLVGKSTAVEKSKKVFHVKKETANERIIQLSELEEIPEFTRVTVEVKVEQTDDPMEVAGAKNKQDLWVGDKSGTTRVTLWEDEIGKMEKGKSYRLIGMFPREFKGKKYLSTSRQNTTIEEIDDIGELKAQVEDLNEGRPTEYKSVRVIGVDTVDTYSACLKCGSKVEDDEDDDFGQCTKCKMIQCREECQQVLTAELMVKTTSGENLPFCAVDQVLLQIAERLPADITKRTLLKARPFTMIQQHGIIRSISRNPPSTPTGNISSA